jgi:hypothetical protein
MMLMRVSKMNKTKKLVVVAIARVIQVYHRSSTFINCIPSLKLLKS